MNGYCSNCRTETTVWRWRLADVGLRFLCVLCSDRLAAMGLFLTAVTADDPRTADRRSVDRGNDRRRFIGGLRWVWDRAA